MFYDLAQLVYEQVCTHFCHTANSSMSLFILHSSIHHSIVHECMYVHECKIHVPNMLAKGINHS